MVKLLSNPVRDYLPLQQGLRRLKDGKFIWEDPLVRDYLPLQQGLRHHLCFLLFQRIFGQRLSSITTRIKTTEKASKLSGVNAVRDYLPLQQGLRPG